MTGHSMRFIAYIAQEIRAFHEQHGRKPEYAMIHPERMAWVWREIGEMQGTGELQRYWLATPKTGQDIVIEGVPLREHIYVPLHNDHGGKYAFFLMSPSTTIGLCPSKVGQ